LLEVIAVLTLCLAHDLPADLRLCHSTYQLLDLWNYLR